jgi:hypothetical protein
MMGVTASTAREARGSEKFGTGLDWTINTFWKLGSSLGPYNIAECVLVRLGRAIGLIIPVVGDYTTYNDKSRFHKLSR